MKFNSRVRIQIAFCWVLALFAGRVAAQSWNATTNYGNWTAIAMSSDGSKIAAIAYLSGILTTNNGGTYVGWITTSTNGGADWQSVTAPDHSSWSVLAASTNGSNLAAACFNGGIYTSPDWGNTWAQSTAQNDTWNCLGSSADGTRLVAGTRPGQIYTSKDAGATFTSRLPQAGYQAFAGALDGSTLVAAVYGGGMYRSTDLGETWAVTPAPSTYWFAMAASANGANLAAVVQNGGIYTSTDAGNTWTLTSAVSTNWSAIASSADGSKLVAAVNGGLIYRSTDSGADWAATGAPSNSWSAINSSTDGSRLVAAANGGGFGGLIYFSTNSGTSWAPASAPSTNWSAISATADGSQWLATVNGGLIYRSTNGGAAWTTNNGLAGLIRITSLTNLVSGWSTNSTITNSAPGSPGQYWSAVAASADGSRVVAIANHSIFTAYNLGTAWQTNVTPWQVVDGEFFSTKNFTPSNHLDWAASGYLWVSNNVPNQNWSSVYSSPDGNTLLALARFGWSCKSTNGGATWATLSTPYDFWQSLATSADGGRLLAASTGYLYQSTNAGTTWNKLAMATNTTAVCSDAFFVSGYSYYTNYYGPGVITTNSGMVTTNYPVLANYFSNSAPIVTGSVSFRPGSFLTMTNDSVVGINLFSSKQTGITNTYVTNLVGGVKTIITNTYPIFSTNVFTAMFDATLQGSNVIGALAGTTTNILGVGAFGTNTIYVKMPVVMPDSVFTSELVASLATPDVSGMSNTNGVTLGTNFVNVLSTNVFIGTNSGINLFVTNELYVTVVITNVIQNWSATASSADGSHLAAAVNGGLIYISTNSGATWFNPDAPSTNWSALAMSADGSQLTAAVNGGLIYSSTNSGTTWVADNVPASNWRAVATSASGAQMVAVIYGGVFYTGQSPVVSPLASTVPVPALQIQLAGGNVVLSWPASATNVVLQQSADLTGGNWSDSPVVPVVSNGQNQVSLPISTVHSLFRLKQP